MAGDGAKGSSFGRLTGLGSTLGILAESPSSIAKPLSSDSSDERPQNPTSQVSDTVAMAKPLIVDVRTQEEWDEGHLQSAVHIPHDEISDEIAKHAKDKQRKIVLYCRSGGRAGVALQALKKLGYTNVENGGGLKDVKGRFEDD